MDLDSYVAEHEPQWQRLEALTKRPGRLSGAEADEVIDLYQKAATHLAVVRGAAYDPELESRLSGLVINARATVTATQPSMLAGIGRFFGAALPASLYRLRWTALGVAVFSTIISAVIAVNMIQNPGLVRQYLTEAEIDRLVNYSFGSYYTANPAGPWSVQLWLHNSMVAASALLLGVLVLPTLVLLYSNAENLGIWAGLMIGHDRADVFFGLLLPHGMLELTAVFFAMAAGLQMAWAWIAPGARTRSRALAEEGRSLGICALGLSIWLLVSGVIEAFVTPSGLPAAARAGIGFVALMAFLAYVIILGRRALAAGVTGDVEGAGATAQQPTEAAV